VSGTLSSRLRKKLTDLPVAIFQNWADFQNYTEDGDSARPILGVFYADTFYFADGTRTLRLKDMVERAVTFFASAGTTIFPDGRGEPAG
jgi:hypothetical protein